MRAKSEIGWGRARSSSLTGPPKPNLFLLKIYLNHEIALYLTRKRLFPANGVELRIRPTCEARQVEKGNCWGRKKGIVTIAIAIKRRGQFQSSTESANAHSLM